MRATEGFVESEGHRLAYLAVNEHLDRPGEPAIVFVHGVLVSVNFWRSCVPPDFVADRAWFALSLPAHHPSTVPAGFSGDQVDDQWFFRVMSGALEALLGDRKAIVVGHSTGGFCALNLAANQAPNVAGVVSVAGFHSGNWGGLEGLLVKLAGLGSWAMPLFATNIWIARRSPLVQRAFAATVAHDKQSYRASPSSERMLDDVRANGRQQDATALFHLFNGISRLEIGHRLRDIRVPCHVFAGTHDPVVSAAQSLLIAGEVPGANTVVFRNVGHMPFMEDTEAYFDALAHALVDINERVGTTAGPTSGEP